MPIGKPDTYTFYRGADVILWELETSWQTYYYIFSSEYKYCYK